MGAQTWSDLLKDSADAEKEFTPLSEGEHELVITETKNHISQNDNPVYSFTAKVESGSEKGKTVKDRIVLSTANPKAIPFFFRKMAALGLDSQFFATEPSHDAISAAMNGRRFVGTVKHTKSDDGERTFANVEGYAPPRGGQSAPPPARGTAPPPVAAAPAPAAAPPAAAPAAPPAAPPAQAEAPAAPPAGAPPVAAVQAPPVEQPTTAPAPAAAPATATPATDDPWAATPPTMPGLDGSAF